jgi:hypothetical protein
MRFWWRNLREIDHLEDPGVDRRIILKWIFKMWERDLDWADLAQDTDRWRAVAKAVMKLHVNFSRSALLPGVIQDIVAIIKSNLFNVFRKIIGGFYVRMIGKTQFRQNQELIIFIFIVDTKMFLLIFSYSEFPAIRCVILNPSPECRNSYSESIMLNFLICHLKGRYPRLGCSCCIV